MPGEQHVNQSELVIFDVATRKSTVVCTAPEGEEPWKDQGLSVCTDQQVRLASDCRVEHSGCHHLGSFEFAGVSSFTMLTTWSQKEHFG
eukprot:SAG31_NODE_2250_length_6083_cov_3.636531_7_plen_89_part_00